MQLQVALGLQVFPLTNWNFQEQFNKHAEQHKSSSMLLCRGPTLRTTNKAFYNTTSPAVCSYYDDNQYIQGAP